MKNFFKKIFLIVIIFFTLNSYTQKYDEKWKKVIEFESDDQIKSAFKEVNDIYLKSKKNKNETELIKTFFYRAKYIQRLEEDAFYKIIEEIEKDRKNVSNTSKTILDYIYCIALTRYAEKISYGRKPNFNSKNNFNHPIIKWNSEEVLIERNKIIEDFIKNKTFLKKTPLDVFEKILDFERKSYLENKNLHEFLSEKYIELLSKDNDNYLYSNTFKLFANKNDYNINFFNSTNFNEIENPNLLLLLKLYQLLENEYPNHKSYTVKRIIFIEKKLNYLNPNYLSKLDSIQTSSKDPELIQQILLEKADYYHERASKNSEINFNEIALEKLDSVINLKKNNYYYNKAIEYKNTITNKHLAFEHKSLLYSNENTRVKVNYKNIDSLQIKIYRAPLDLSFKNRDVEYTDDLVLDYCKDKELIAQKKYTLKQGKKHFLYSTEIVLPQLETGHYIIVFSANKNDSENKTVINHSFITVSNLAIITENHNLYDNYQIVNRKTGEPLKSIQITIDSTQYQSDKFGIVKIIKSKSSKKSYINTKIMAINEKDTLIQFANRHNNFQHTSQDKNKKTVIVNFFSDREIYRPGQKMFVKGIAIKKEINGDSIVPNQTFLIEIEDSNTTIKEFEIKTNDYGSFDFEFEIPKNSLTGTFYINVEEPEKLNAEESLFFENYDLKNSSLSFQVEEYKKPTFQIKINPVTENYSLEDNITIKGNASMFSGAPLTNATVSYSIYRFSSYHNQFNRKNETELLSKNIETDEEGNFNISFHATIDETIKKEFLPIYNYVIQIKVTDINGETQTTKTSIKLAHHSLILDASLNEIVNTSKKNNLKLSSTNLNYEDTPCKGKIDFYLIEEFSNKFKSANYFPEIPLISNEEFEQLFPYEKINTNSENEAQLLYSQTVDTKINKEIDLDFLKNLKPGNYKLHFYCTDKNGYHIEKTKNFKVIHGENQIQNKLFTYKIINEDSMLIDNFIEVELYSVVAELYFTFQVESTNSIISEHHEKINNYQKKIRIPLNYTKEKKLALRMDTYFESSLFSENSIFDFQLKNQFLTVDVGTMNYKFEPSTKEKWSFTIKDSNNSAIAEVLATMYDQSLDQFINSQWSYSNFYDRFSYFNPNKRNAIDVENQYVNFESIATKLPYLKLKNNSIDLFWFGLTFEMYKNYLSNSFYNKKKATSSRPKNTFLISGQVFDISGMPLPGATIRIKNSSRETSTDFDGYFEIEGLVNEIIEISFVGYKDAEYKIFTSNNKNVIKIVLEDDNSLYEVTVASQGIKREKKALGYAVSMVTDDEINEKSYSKITQELKGKAPGVNIQEKINSTESETKIIIRGYSTFGKENITLFVVDGVLYDLNSIEKVVEIISENVLSIEVKKDPEVIKKYGNDAKNGVVFITTKKSIAELTQVKTRKKFNETAFFYPNLRTDKNGNISFDFEAPESLSQWKFRLLAHTKEAKLGYLEKMVVTQKEFMISTNLPRFFREKDTITISTKIINLTNDQKEGLTQLQLYDAESMQLIENSTIQSKSLKEFSVNPKSSTKVDWTIIIPKNSKSIHYKIVAKSGNFSDGEENILPVLTNNLLVTESIPIWVKGNSKKEFVLENLKNNTSNTLQNHQLTLEYCTNPTWLAIQSLPYLMEYPFECSEQTFSRFFSNCVATEIMNQNPNIKQVFDKWKNTTQNTSKLNQNEELKSILIHESPWLRDAENEEIKKKNLATLFELEKLSSEITETLDKIIKKQNKDGSFSWFEGGPENFYITRYLVSGFGQLKKIIPTLDNKTDNVTKKAIIYMDKKIMEEYKQKIKSKTDWFPIKNDELHYLYARSFYLKDIELSDSLKIITDTYLKELKSNWIEKTLFEKGLSALVLNRFGEKTTAKKIINSLKETSSTNEDWGMYWIENTSSWEWHKSPIETQSLLIEAFHEIENDEKSINEMKTWLIKNKQINHWSTTKSTTQAIYALLLQGNTNWISIRNNTKIKIGSEKILTKKISESEMESETGYIKLNFGKDEINSNFYVISIDNKSITPGIGGIYWQYFEELEKIKDGQNNPLNVIKEMYVKKGQTLEKITNTTSLKVGDIITIKLFINADENMEFVHLKDMRTSAFEPIDVLSGYSWENSLEYYKSTKDASTNFFFDIIPKGRYELEYDVKINNKGNVSSGITTIQSMYAPEFSNHTKGNRISVD